MPQPARRSIPILAALSLVAMCAGVLPVAAQIQNPITAAREAFRKAQEEAKRKAQEEAQRRTGQAPAPAQPQAPPQAAPSTGVASPIPSGSAPTGTAETTAALAKAAMFTDVAGLKLGMPLQDAPAVLKSLNLRPMREPQIEIVWPLDNTNVEKQPPPNAPRSVYLVEYVAADGQGITEYVELRAARHPNPSVVTSIERKLVYRAGQGPARDTIVAGLRQKYGPESLVISDFPTTRILRWYFDEQRQALQGNLAKQESACGGGAGGGVRDNDGLCPTLTVIDVNIANDASGVVMEIAVRAVSRPLHRSAEAATQAFLRQVDEARREQQRLESSKRATPKL
jgi:hypothetical protein